MKIEALYLDMDGVLADFEAALLERGVVDNQGLFHHLPIEQWTPAQLKLDGQVRKCMELPDFWNKIPLMAGAKALWQYASGFNLYVLTATPRETAHRDRIAQQKREWIQHHFGPIDSNRIIVCEREEKKNYARPGAVLVDDMEPNCSEWRYHHGTAIRHIGAQTTIHKLIELTAAFKPERCGLCGEQPGHHKLTCPDFDPDPHGMNYATAGATGLPKPALRDKTSAERKAEPIHSGVMLYFPDALAAVARVSKAGNDKHNPGEPLHWARGKSTDQMDASARHMLTLDKVDPESGELDAAHNVWRGLAELQLLEEARLARLGIKPYSGVVP